MVTSGRLDRDRGGGDVVRYTPPPGTGQPFERKVTTDTKGDWSDSIVARTTTGSARTWGVGEWLIEPRFEGDAEYAPSTGPSCRVMVFGN